MTAVSLHNKPVVAGADTLAGSDAVRAPTPATTPTAAPEATARPVEQPDAGPVPPTGPASTFDPDQARAAAADVAYPEPKIRTADLDKGFTPEPPAPSPNIGDLRLIGPEPIDISWITPDAACYRHDDPDLWFDIGDPDRVAEAKSYCNRCPLRERCLEHALAHETDGIWGALTPGERRRLSPRRRKGRPVLPIAHGTTRGYAKHQDHPHLFGEPCAACKAAMARYSTERRRALRETGGMSGGDILDIRRGA